MKGAHSLVAVVGSHDADPALREHARDVGRAIARCGAGLVCGGLGGVMEAACEGAIQAAGEHTVCTVGILPGVDAAAANPHVQVRIPTGLGSARNLLVVRSAAAAIAVGGESGTLSEIAFAWQLGLPLAGYVPAGGWGARLAGERLDSRHPDPIVAIRSIQQLETWLQHVLARLTRVGEQNRSGS